MEMKVKRVARVETFMVVVECKTKTKRAWRLSKDEI
jgi:hypothetical protein